VGRLELTGSLRAWADLLRGPGASAAAASVVPGALRYYDLPDLVHALGPRVTVSTPVDGQGRPAPLSAFALPRRMAAAAE
jgi:hypothetical protein